jgi:hypothetical protein
MKNLSNEINWFIQKYEYSNMSEIKYGEVINDLVVGYNLSEASEEECVEAFEDMKAYWLRQEYIRATTSVSTLESLLKREAKTLDDITEIISEEFEIFDKNVLLDKCFENRLTITYYRNPEYCEKRYYIKIVLLIELDNKIKKILNIKKGCLQ